MRFNPKHKECGFTLLELILVISLVTGVLLLMTYKVSRPKNTALLNSAETCIAKAFEIGRMKAVLKKESVTIQLLPETKQINVGNEVFYLPKGISISAQQEWSINPQGLLDKNAQGLIHIYMAEDKARERLLTVTKTGKVFPKTHEGS
ncbi:MAG: hypothetical protein COZ46_02800 [Verrucomicrobia bacterium CG_4_10_14_3_um_filter_43_23]|nr:MAG: hypothetical protein AUJ82_00865 [Verrucomicrobia bacterium CG1_02_43_26]PIP59450.1 MAG: hypothetical protein COX01_02420 [Verrucomicrobia bacterium CG22_combo_CG10-13_8_21_14_all_43_17]PIX58609.1 MAG: hypothetical protein COZ46_02800 [Verrucomicrobia bacterium CG_4_10_14_3_um_filter_43_23]PIY61434.1 MAG: hypothetical protein COY94_05165 [Verrucomicrobia bacterium CG_4_10_14_0_8_um_filter_43_34]PJA43802.1 MAG: hypothetical protein CO175_06085 [Verrucomicrobia bacterium CG_4_9_14_3_um_fi